MMFIRSKKLIASILSFILIFLSIFAGQVSAEATEGETKITLLATSDIHGRYFPWDYAMDTKNETGSLTQIYTLIKKIRAENPHTILLDAGDLIQDNSSELFQKMNPHPAMIALNKMGYDAWTLGNHEYDYTLEILNNITQQFKGAALAGNMYKKTGEQCYKPYTIVERDGIKIGIIGMTTPMVAEFKEGTNIFDDIVFKNPTEETKKAVEELKGKVDAIVGLFHMGVENENNNPNTGVRDIASGNPELTAVFAGHMHTLVKSETINGVLIAEPDKYGTHLSRIDLVFEKKEGKVTIKDKAASAVPVKQADGSMAASDAELEALMLPFHQIARDDANTIIGQLTGMDMVASDRVKGIPTVQTQETPLTDFFSEVMLHYSKADVVAHQIDTDFAKLDVGPIKKKDIAFNYRYAGGEVTVYQVSGKDLKDYMEWSAGYFNSSKPGDVTISFDKTRRASKYSTNDIFGGVTYEIDLSKPYGERIINLKWLDGMPVEPDDEIKLGLNAYRMKALIGKGGALEGRNFKKLSSTQDEAAFGEVEGRIRNLAARYIKEVKNGVIEGTLSNHWRITGVDAHLPQRKAVEALINAGVIEVPKTEDGKYSNIAAINVYEPISAEMIKALSEKTGLDLSGIAGSKNTGELYEGLSRLISGQSGETQDDKAEIKSNETYIVKQGDCLWRIAKQYGIYWGDIAKHNQLKNPHLIFPGQRLRIMGR